MHLSSENSVHPYRRLVCITYHEYMTVKYRSVVIVTHNGYNDFNESMSLSCKAVSKMLAQLKKNDNNV